VFEIPWGDIAAASILASLPPILIVIGLGRFLVRGGKHVVTRGKAPERNVVIEFPDMAAAKAWYGSAEYGPLVKVRQSASTGSLLLVEGA
jgi:uncharacterized protein (DUF1330 family)